MKSMKSLFSICMLGLLCILASPTISEAQGLHTNEYGSFYHPVTDDTQFERDVAINGNKFSIIDTTMIMVVGDTAAVADTSKDAILDIRSLSRGVLLPRMVAAQRAAIYSPPEGLLVFDTDSNKLCFYDGTKWQCPAGATP